MGLILISKVLWVSKIPVLSQIVVFSIDQLSVPHKPLFFAFTLNLFSISVSTKTVKYFCVSVSTKVSQLPPSTLCCNSNALKFGVSGTMGNTLKENGDVYLSTVENTEGGGLIIDRDTISGYSARIESPIQSVLSAGIGKDNKWFVGAEYTFRDGIDFKGGIYDEIK